MKITDLQKLGQSIALFRRVKGLTQKEFSILLKTSQSAVARIEKGEQNITTDMISKINKVLGKNVISLATPMLNLRITGGRTLKGEICVRSSRNSSVCLAYAALLNNGTTTIKNISPINEVFRLVELYKLMGVNILEKNLDLKINFKNITTLKSLFPERINSWPLLIGSLSSYFKKFNLPYRQLEYSNLNVHLRSLEQLGFKFEIKNNILSVDSTFKKSGEVVMYESSDSATLNVIFASLFCKGETTIKNGSFGHQVQDVCNYLKALGYKINFVTPFELKIIGSNKPLTKLLEYEPIPDPNEAFFYICAALVTNSQITISNVPIDFLQVEIIKLKSMGMQYVASNVFYKNGFKVCTLTINKSSLNTLPDKLYSKSFPGIAVDNLPYFAAVACLANGRTEIYDFITEDRILSMLELKNLGADVLVSDNHRAYITGVTKLAGADIDISLGAHPGNMLLLSMLGAKGVSILRNAYSLNTWYEGLFAQLNKLGANITTLHEI